MSCKGNCGSASCGFGKKKFAFGNSANSFFVPNFTNNAKIGECLQNGVYYPNNAAPLMRYGKKKNAFGNNGGGPMKIGKKKS